MMQQLQGAAALTAFRCERLLEEIQAAGIPAQKVDAHYLHLVELDSALSDTQRNVLDKLLTYGEEASGGMASNDQFDYIVHVVPRPGTISPWSTKATEIAVHCGLTIVLRLERGITYRVQLAESEMNAEQQETLQSLLHDRMTEVALAEINESYFSHTSKATLGHVSLLENGLMALQQVNSELGLGLSDEELAYLSTRYQGLARNPTDVELMMFAQANSEHCRHKIFNAQWVIDGEEQDRSLFSMIRNTAEMTSEGILSAYSDNAAVVEGYSSRVLISDPLSHEYRYHEEPSHLLMKVETHNHPTAIAPFPGAATGCGGEIRDEGATGRGAKPKAGLTGFTVSNLRIPGFEQPWEEDNGKPGRMASALNIMLEGPIGGAAFNNEFGRPNLAGYFRTLEQVVPGTEGKHLYGFHKPIMIAGGMGNVRPEHVLKQQIAPGMPIVVLGGPAMLIGLGGGAASSQDAGTGSEELDFASVQRGNPEMQRRCQEVITSCSALGAETPIVSIHDVGAGGLSNAVPEIIHDCDRGGRFDINKIPTAEKGLSPLQLWCNEAQERYILALDPDKLKLFEAICEREQCPYAVIGEATAEEHLVLQDDESGHNPIDLPMDVLFGNTPKLVRQVKREQKLFSPFDFSNISLDDAVERVLRFPAVASKKFLITIGDRSVGGLVARDQMVGPWQVPVADVAVTCSGFDSYSGEAMAMGEKSPVAVIDGAASGRMAVGEALTNLMMARIERLSQVKLSANWMAAAGAEGQDVELFDTVKAIGMELCPELGIAIPVGKDSLSMRTVWHGSNGEKSMVSPLSVVISAFAPVVDVRQTLTPELKIAGGSSRLFLLDLGRGKNRLGGSAFAQAYGQMGDVCPDLDQAQDLKNLFQLIQALIDAQLVISAHDRSDGGLLATLCEMAFAGHAGIHINIPQNVETLEFLFAEELGVVLQVADENAQRVGQLITDSGLDECCFELGVPTDSDEVVFEQAGHDIHRFTRSELHKIWSETSYRMQALRDNSMCAAQEFEVLSDSADKGLNVSLPFDPAKNVAAPYVNTSRPKIAILREQGINGQQEMAAAFERVGFTAIDVHMSDLASGSVSLDEFSGLAVCGGFSYGDVLGAGGGWAKSILMHSRMRDQFSQFFMRTDTFGLGVCNGCQMLSGLKELIPGAESWPAFKRNISEQFEARLSLVEIIDSPSVLLQGMEGARLPVVVAHGEGRAHFADSFQDKLVAVRYVDSSGLPTEAYPANPNGSPQGITGLSSQDGRFTIMMPHPERCFRTVQHSWHPDSWGENGPWLRMFANARKWLA